MSMEDIIYPGFNKSLKELNCIEKISKNTYGIIDFTDIEWVRSALSESAKSIDSSIKFDFRKPTQEQLDLVLNKVGADKTPEQIKDSFNDGKRVIGISSGKGGVGKSTVTSLLALAYASKGKKVGIVDADIWGYSIPKILGAKFPPIPFSNRIFPSKINDINVISMEYFVKQDEAVIWRGPMLHKAIEQFLFEVIWEDIDILLIDMPPGTGDVSISLSQLLNFFETIIVTTPQSNATLVAERAGIMSKKVNSSIIGVIENMSFMKVDDSIIHPFGQGGGSSLAEKLEVPLIGQMPLDNLIAKYCEKGRLQDITSDKIFHDIIKFSDKIDSIAPKKKPISLKIN
ncbi:MAG: P-loop NTPase [Actinobacteria bacterium]|jgi:Mrp family chromosome partitioning ATPase|nr:P-loop NTPase [Actinomycetota bacterium]MBL6832782.1 P-loop NTPase [Candidatus Actinomarina sp.]